MYGNRTFLEELTGALVSEGGVGVKKVQRATAKSDVSGILYYMRHSEVRAIFECLYPPGTELFDREFYSAVMEVMAKFDK